MDDLINRKDIGAAIDNWLTIDRYYHPYSKQKTIPVSELVDIIKQLPSAQPERKVAKWILKQFFADEYGNKRWRLHCSECDAMAYKVKQKYCMACGAKMMEVEE